MLLLWLRTRLSFFYQMWFAVYFINNPPLNGDECEAFNSKSVCESYTSGSIDGSSSSSSLTRTTLNTDDISSSNSLCSWNDGIEKCTPTQNHRDNFFTVVTIGLNISYLLSCGYYFFKGFAKKNHLTDKINNGIARIKNTSFSRSFSFDKSKGKPGKGGNSVVELRAMPNRVPNDICPFELEERAMINNPGLRHTSIVINPFIGKSAADDELDVEDDNADTTG